MKMQPYRVDIDLSSAILTWSPLVSTSNGFSSSTGNEVLRADMLLADGAIAPRAQTESFGQAVHDEEPSAAE
jgi:hypothetical protein